MSQTNEQTFSKELLNIIKESVSERGFDKSLHDTIANQYVIEQVQTEFHCILNALIQTLIENKVIQEETLKQLIDENVASQEQMLKEMLEKDASDSNTVTE